MMLLTGQKVQLRDLRHEDIPTMLQWENDPEHWADSLRSQTLDETDLKLLYFQNQMDVMATGQKRFAIENSQTEELVGFVDIFKLKPAHKTVEVGILVGQSHRGKGFAQMALLQLETYCFGVLGLKSIIARVREKNSGSLALFLKCGYLQVKTVNQRLKSSESENVIVLSKNAS